MNIKKICIKFNSGFITPLESDTFLGYVFAKGYAELEDIFNDFKNGEPPFVLSNGFVDGTIPKPLFYQHNRQDKESLDLVLKSESDRKLKKKSHTIKFTVDNLKKLKEGKEINYSHDLGKGILSVSDIKSSIPRFNSGNASPFFIQDIKYSQQTFVLYVKIYKEDKFNLWRNISKEILEFLGRGKGISRGYGKVESISCVDINEHEFCAFQEIDKRKKENNIYFVINQYKPTDEELNLFDLENTYLNIINKNTKTLQKHTFKGNMKFISDGSIIKLKQQHALSGGYYTNLDKNSFNFGYIF